jgi:hypothetical protein
MAQTHYQNLADALATAGACLTGAGAGITTASERLPNLPAIHDSQTIIDLINQKHDQMIQQINTLRTDITGLRTDITGLRTDMMNRLDAR